MQTKLTGLHLFAGKLSLFALHFVGAEQSPAPTERTPKAPLAGELSAEQTERLYEGKLTLYPTLFVIFIVFFTETPCQMARDWVK